MGKRSIHGSGSVYSDLVKQIRCGKALQNVSTHELAELVAMPESTLYSRLQHPEDFRLDELLRISRALCIEFGFKCKLVS